MPYLDVSYSILNPMLADKFSVLRRQEVVDTHGRSTVPFPEWFTGTVGVVTAASPNDLKRHPEVDFTQRTLSVITRFRLFGSAATVAQQSFKPDLVYLGGDFFIVRTVDPYPRFGAGFVQTLVESIDPQDYPVGFPPVNVTRLQFNIPQNAAWAALIARAAPCS